jgi:apolipoprotein N-acyltransferase
MTFLPRLRLLFALASGLFLALAFPPYDITMVAWFAPAALVLVSIDARWWVAPLGGLLHGIGFFALSMPWVYTVMRTHGGLGPVAAAGVFLLMIIYLSLYSAAFAWGVRYVGRAGIARACLAAPFLWVAAEFARGRAPELGLPWNLLGYALADSLGFLQIASLAGISGLSFLLLSFNAVLTWFLLTRTRRAWVVTIAFALVVLPAGVVGPRFVPALIGSRTAHLVQLNLPQTTEIPPDWNQKHAADMDEIEALSITAAETDPGLIVWPEAPAPFTLRDPEFAARAARIAVASQSHFLAGVVEWKPAPDKWDGPYNSATLLDPTGRPVFTYDKIHLVPFGEYVPFGRLLGFAKQLTAEVGGFKAAKKPVVGELPDAPGPAELRTPGPPRKFGVLICFEAIFPGEVRWFVSNGAELLINLSNDAWLGSSAGREQHLMMARVRAAENRRWLLRATNNGHTVAVDPYGRVVTRLVPDRRGVLAAPYDFRTDRSLYSLLGDWLAWLCLIASAGFVAAAFRRTAAGGSEVGK